MKYELKAIYDMGFTANPFIELRFFTDIIYRKIDKVTGESDLTSRDTISAPKDGSVWKCIKPFSLILFKVYSKSYKGNNSSEVPIIKTSLTERSKWVLCKRIDTIINAIKTDQELYYLTDGKLVLNIEKAKEYEEFVRTSNSYTIHVAPAVVPIIRNKGLEEDAELYEGVVIDIPGKTSGIKMTFEEAEYFSDYLKNFDMNQMTMQIINNCKFTGISGQIINTGMKVESLCKELKEKEEIKEDKTHEQ